MDFNFQNQLVNREILGLGLVLAVFGEVASYWVLLKQISHLHKENYLCNDNAHRFA